MSKADICITYFWLRMALFSSLMADKSGMGFAMIGGDQLEWLWMHCEDFYCGPCNCCPGYPQRKISGKIPGKQHLL